MSSVVCANKAFSDRRG